MKKTELQLQGKIKKSSVPNPELIFSFKYFDSSDGEICPQTFNETYTQTLMERLKALSAWTVKDFIEKRCKSIRNHPHDWSKTSRPDGFRHLNAQLRTQTGWQFQLSSNQHGRVHGFLLDNIFYVIWLDLNHKLYP